MLVGTSSFPLGHLLSSEECRTNTCLDVPLIQIHSAHKEHTDGRDVALTALESQNDISSMSTSSVIGALHLRVSHTVHIESKVLPEYKNTSFQSQYRIGNKVIQHTRKDNVNSLHSDSNILLMDYKEALRLNSKQEFGITDKNAIQNIESAPKIVETNPEIKPYLTETKMDAGVAYKDLRKKKARDFETIAVFRER